MSSLLHKARADHPLVTFRAAGRFAWQPAELTIDYASDFPHAQLSLLHELGHARLGHDRYDHDVSLLTMEAAAWQEARQLAERYDIDLSEDIIEDHLDSYRDWLHQRSRCPGCTATGYQSAPHQYSCIACGTDWRVNEARSCALKRFQTPKRKIPA